MQIISRDNENLVRTRTIFDNPQASPDSNFPRIRPSRQLRNQNNRRIPGWHLTRPFKPREPLAGVETYLDERAARER